MTDLFGSDPPPLSAAQRRAARRRGHRKAHPCSACGRRTYRRIRLYPTLGYEDARCQTCTTRGLWPDQHTDRRQMTR